MGRINTVPKGLQAYLGNTNFGDNPTELGAVAAAIVDLDKFLRADKMRAYVSPVLAGVSVGRTQVARIEVPENELWFLTSVGFTGARSAGTGTGTVTLAARLDGYPGSEFPGTAAGEFMTLYQTPSEQNAFGGSGFIGFAEWLPQPLPLPAGVGISWWFGSNFDTTNDQYDCRGECFYYAVKV